MAKAKIKSRYGARSRAGRRLKSAAIWIGVLSVVGVLFYSLVNTSGIAYNERHLSVVDFSSLSDDQKREVLIEANNGRCTCGCGMTLARCVATDMTCPIRTDNITKIRGLVQKALHSGGGS